jgi:hypothetical protein
MYIMSLETIYLLEVWSSSIPINSENLTIELNDPHFAEIGRFRI